MDKAKPYKYPAPIWSSLLEYRGENNLRLHMPGHLGGRGLPDIYHDLAELDLTEVPGIDDLHQPASAIKEALNLLAQAYGAHESFFLVNGATSGIHALMMSLGGSEARVLVPRNAHRSVWGGMVLSGVFPQYIACRYDAESGLPLALDPEVVSNQLKSDLALEAVVISSPSYFGTGCNISRLAAITKDKGIPLLVDEAHGSHFAFHPSYPRSALAQGASASVNGLHKTLPVLNQGGCLHINREFKYRDRLATSLSLLTTTSPSFLLLASIDTARKFMQEEGYAYLEKAWQMAEKYRPMINKLPGLRILDLSSIYDEHATGQDPLKLTIHIRGLSIDGLQLMNLLRRQYGIQAELAQPRIILFMMSMFHREEEWNSLFKALRNIARQYAIPAKNLEPIPLPPLPRVLLSPRQAFWQSKHRVKLQESQGYICGEMIAPYPPGVPCLLPGELIDAEILEYLWYIKQRGLFTHGPDDPALDHIMVLDETVGG